MGQYHPGRQPHACLKRWWTSDKPQHRTSLIKDDPENLDGLNFLAGQNMSVVNRKAMQGTILAHTEGGVPNMVLEVPEINEHEFGYMVYFFEKACAISGYLLGGEPLRPAGRGELQEEHVRAARQAGL